MLLYRYMSLDKFKSLCEGKSLHFVNPFVHWNDTKEGFLYRCYKDNNDKIKKAFGSHKYAQLQIQLIENGGLYPKSKENCLDWFSMRCQSWCKSENCLHMWEEYGRDGVCVSVESARLLNLRYGKHKVEGLDVEYTDNSNFERIIDSLCRNHGEFCFTKLLQFKDIDFIKENEYRLYVTLLDEKGNYTLESDRDYINVPIDIELDHFFETIMISPYANVDVCDDIMSICKQFLISTSKVHR